MAKTKITLAFGSYDRHAPLLDLELPGDVKLETQTAWIQVTVVRGTP
jgi:hypothetical protein